MKIALVTDWFSPRVGGIEVHVRELAVRLRERGEDAVVVTPWPGPPEVAGVPVERLPVGILPRLDVSLSPTLVGSVRRCLVSGGFDVLHAHVSLGSPTAFAAGYVASRLGLPAVGTFHSAFGRWGLAYLVAAPVLRWRRWPFRATAVSEAVAEDLRRILGGRPVSVLSSAIDPEAWRGTAPVPHPGRLRLVTTARLHPRKRVDALVRIAGEVRRRAPSGVDVSLEIVGEGPQRPALERLVRRLGLEGVVTLRGEGSDADVRALLARGDVFVNACPRESFGLAALEALARGIPVVARAEGGMSTFVEDGHNGVLVDSDAAMTEALVGLASRGEALEGLRRGAAEGISAEHSWSGLVDRHLELYAEVLEGRGTTRVASGGHE